ncbi:hypothetical protein [Agrococcus jejuensis]|uniref:Uncharacterized protein n=1 Tax=Agrococcus jejuensis TaxID=399736 RepID=A0A1G8GDV0_9MICO|nr:hypothetical protein [Agrococcus jejuensis]SDH92574.1 hypothetical protein SAMN04489720_2885 [Agrococcus jejuensis]
MAEARDGPALVDDLLSRDRSRILDAVWAIIRARDDAALHAVRKRLAEVEDAVDEVDLGGMLASNGRHVTHAIDRVRMHWRGECLCRAYRDHEMYDPAQEVAFGHVTLVEEIPVIVGGSPWRPRRICACTACGQRYDVTEDEGHYVWWRWRTVEDVAAKAAAEAALPVPTPRKVVTNPRSPARARRRRSSPSS